MGDRLLGAVTSIGYGLAAIVFAFINVIPYGWRGLYAIALIPLVLIIPLRRVLPESRASRRRDSTGSGRSISGSRSCSYLARTRNGFR